MLYIPKSREETFHRRSCFKWRVIFKSDPSLLPSTPGILTSATTRWVRMFSLPLQRRKPYVLRGKCGSFPNRPSFPSCPILRPDLPHVALSSIDPLSIDRLTREVCKNTPPRKIHVIRTINHSKSHARINLSACGRQANVGIKKVLLDRYNVVLIASLEKFIIYAQT